MTKKKIGGLIAILAIAGGTAGIYYSQSDASRKFDLNPYNALGAGVAEETAKLLGSKGQVIVIEPDTGEFKNPAVEGQRNAFQKTLKKKGITIATTVKFKLTPMERMATGGAVPRDQFLNVLQGHANTGAIILFCGFPQLTTQDYDTLKQSGAKVVVASGYVPGYRNLLEAQVIHLAIVPQFDRTSTPTKKPQTVLERFESEFVVLTPDNIANFPERQ